MLKKIGQLSVKELKFEIEFIINFLQMKLLIEYQLQDSTLKSNVVNDIKRLFYLQAEKKQII